MKNSPSLMVKLEPLTAVNAPNSLRRLRMTISAKGGLLPGANEVAVEVEERQFAHAPGFVGGPFQARDAGGWQAKRGPFGNDRVGVGGTQVGAGVTVEGVEGRVVKK